MKVKTYQNRLNPNTIVVIPGNGFENIPKNLSKASKHTQAACQKKGIINDIYNTDLGNMYMTYLQKLYIHVKYQYDIFVYSLFCKH